MVVAIAAASTGEPGTPASTLSATVPSAQSVPLTTAMSTGSRSASFASASVGRPPEDEPDRGAPLQPRRPHGAHDQRESHDSRRGQAEYPAPVTDVAGQTLHQQ